MVSIILFRKLISLQSFLFLTHKKNRKLQAKQNLKMKIISCIVVKAWRRTFSTVAERKCRAVNYVLYIKKSFQVWSSTVSAVSIIG